MRSEKKLLMRALTARCERHPSLLFANYQGMKAGMAIEFRRELRKSKAEFEVVRKRMMIKALAQTGTEVTRELLPGHIGVIFALDDPLVAIKKAFEFAKERALTLQFLGGRYQGRLIAADEAERLSRLPSLDQLRAEFLSLLTAPAAQLLGAMNALLAAVPRCLEERARRDGAQ